MTPELHQQIAERAYFIWLDEGMHHGRADTHWLAAEHAHVLQETAAPVAIKAKRAPVTRVARPAKTGVAKRIAAKANVAKASVAKAAAAKARPTATPLHA